MHGQGGCKAAEDQPQAWWSGPNGFLATGATAQVTDDGMYTVKAIGGNGCTVSARLRVAAFECPPAGCVPIGITRVR